MKKLFRIGVILVSIICSIIPVMSSPVNADVTTNYYPDSNPESTSFDGIAYVKDKNESWSALRAESGTYAVDTTPEDWIIAILCSTTPNQWARIGRSLFLFDTSSIPDDAVVVGATLSIYSPTGGKSTFGTNLPDINVYGSAPASNTGISIGDFQTMGSVPYCDTPISYANWITATPFWNTFVLNSAGISAISKTGISKLGLRNANYDVAGVTPPTWTSGATMCLFGDYAEKGTTYKPKLSITYAYLPTGVLSFNVVNNGDNTTTASWSLSGNATGVRLVRNYVVYAENKDDPTNIYQGTALSYVDIGLMPYFDKCYSIWEYSGAGWSINHSENISEREVMNVTLTGGAEVMTLFPPALYGVAIGLVLIVINLKAKMALLWLAAAICFIGVFFDPALSDTYYQAAAIVIIIVCLIAGFFGYKSKRASLG